MRTVFMGTPEFAVPSLRKLHEAGHDVVLVVTQPDRPAGRGRKLTPGPVKAYALEHGLAVRQPRTLRDDDAVAMLRDLEPDLLIVAADQLFNQAAKMRYMSGGRVKVPLVIRTQQGGGRGHQRHHHGGHHQRCRRQRTKAVATGGIPS